MITNLSHVNIVSPRLGPILKSESLNKSPEDNIEVLLGKPDKILNIFILAKTTFSHLLPAHILVPWPKGVRM